MNLIQIKDSYLIVQTLQYVVNLLKCFFDISSFQFSLGVKEGLVFYGLLNKNKDVVVLDKISQTIVQHSIKCFINVNLFRNTSIVKKIGWMSW